MSTCAQGARGAARTIAKGRRPRGSSIFCAAVVLCALSAAPRTALGATPPNWLRDHISADAAVVVGWRSAWINGPHSGFNLLGGGGEINLGLEFSGGYAVLAGARVLSGAGSSPSGQGLNGADRLTFLEATGQIGGQLGLTDWVRVELGAVRM